VSVDGPGKPAPETLSRNTNGLRQCLRWESSQSCNRKRVRCFDSILDRRRFSSGQQPAPIPSSAMMMPALTAFHRRLAVRKGAIPVRLEWDSACCPVLVESVVSQLLAHCRRHSTQWSQHFISCSQYPGRASPGHRL